MSEDKDEKSAGQVILDAADNKFSLRLELQQNGMECRGAVTSEKPAKRLKTKHLLKELARCGITQGILKDEVDAFCEAVKNPPVATHLLAKGIPPGPGRNGWLELLVKLGDDDSRLQEDEDGRIDFHAQQFFGMVEPGAAIAAIHPPAPGEPGRTVSGEPVPSAPGKPLQLKVGEGARLEDDGLHVVSEMVGRVICDGHNIAVSEAFIVPGNVDFTTGHIDFNGLVEIRGDVLDDFNVRAGKGLKVHGNIGVCHIESDGNIEINGMAGKGRGHIKCGANLLARYLNDVIAFCHGDIIVQNEILNCHLHAGGAILVTNGMIVGGECIAYSGIEAHKIGAVSGVATKVAAGIDYLELCRKNELCGQLTAIDKEIDYIKNTLGPAHEQTPAIDDLPAAIKRLRLRLDELKADRQQLRGQIEAAAAKPAASLTTAAQINVRGRLNEKTIITLGETTEKIRYEREGPFSIIERQDGRTLEFITLRPLRKKHAD